jgi:recombination protein RecR
MSYPEPIQQLIREFDKLPGVGARTAERLAFHVLRMAPDDAFALALAIRDVKKHVKPCSSCCTVTLEDPCPRCADPNRDQSTILVVEQPHDVEAFDAAGYRGVYHVLGGALNPVEGIEPKDLTIERLVKRAGNERVKEIVLGVDPDFEGDGTVLYLRSVLKRTGTKLSRLARGIPAGSSVEYSNASVLADAISGRRVLEGET